MAADKKQDGLLDKVGRLFWRLIVSTVGSCMRYRVTGLAAEAAFFAVLSMPPLIFALAGVDRLLLRAVQRPAGRGGPAGGASTCRAGR